MTPNPAKAPVTARKALGDFTADRRLLMLAAMALVVGSGGAGAAWMLIRLITLTTNLVWFGRFDVVTRSLEHLSPSAWMVIAPVLGGLVIGLMARFGGEDPRPRHSRSHRGNPDRRQPMSPKVAILKPLSSAISIGSGGPFGAEGPIIMTGGAIGSLFAQFFHLSANERKTLLVAGAAAGMTAVFGTPIAAVMLAVELLLFEWRPRSFIPVAVAAITAEAGAACCYLPGPLFPFQGGRSRCCPGGAGCLRRSGRRGRTAVGLADQAALRAGGRLRALPIHWMWWPALGGLGVGLGGLIEPRALGVGYDVIRRPADGHDGRPGGADPAGGQGGHLAGGPVVGNLGRGAGAAADPGRGDGLAGRPGAAGRSWILGAAGHGRMLGGTMRSPLTA
jgi:CIC family chloride channel protein